MAEQLDTDRPKRRRFYPWPEWTNGKVWRARQGEDFTVTTASFQTALHQRARHQGICVQTGSPEKGVVEFRFYVEGDGNGAGSRV
jgi:hypothetical protein